MTTLQAGDVVTGFFTGSQTDKSRPAIVVSSDIYHAHRPDVVICFLTTQVAGASAPTDYALQDLEGCRTRSAQCISLLFRDGEKERSHENWPRVRCRLARSASATQVGD